MKTFVEQFEDFARSKPAEEEYPYWDPNKCACAMFYASLGQTYATFMPTKGLELEPLARREPHTYGALADRIRAYRNGEL